jgi:single-strand DNA-binding protein
MYQNSVDLMGFLGADAETRNTRDGVPLTVLSLATKRSWKDRKGEWQSHTDWHRVSCFGQVAEFASTLKTGAHIHITGYLRSREMRRTAPAAARRAEPKRRCWLGKSASSGLPSPTGLSKRILPPRFPPAIPLCNSRHQGLAAGPSFLLLPCGE